MTSHGKVMERAALKIQALNASVADYKARLALLEAENDRQARLIAALKPRALDDGDARILARSGGFDSA